MLDAGGKIQEVRKQLQYLLILFRAWEDHPDDFQELENQQEAEVEDDEEGEEDDFDNKQLEDLFLDF